MWEIIKIKIAWELGSVAMAIGLLIAIGSAAQQKPMNNQEQCMIHIRVDHEELNSKRRFACGIGPELPEGDVYYFEGEAGADLADCPGCNPNGPRKFGTPISQLSGRPGEPGYDKFVKIAKSWGHD